MQGTKGEQVDELIPEARKRRLKARRQARSDWQNLDSLRVAMEHATEEARKKHLKEHPNADPKNHVVKRSPGLKSGPSESRTKKLLQSANTAMRKAWSSASDSVKTFLTNASERKRMTREMTRTALESVPLASKAFARALAGEARAITMDTPAILAAAAGAARSVKVERTNKDGSKEELWMAEGLLDEDGKGSYTSKDSRIKVLEDEDGIPQYQMKPRKLNKQEAYTLYGVGVYAAGVALSFSGATPLLAGVAASKAFGHSITLHAGFKAMSGLLDDVFLGAEAVESAALAKGIAAPVNTGMIPGLNQIWDAIGGVITKVGADDKPAELKGDRKFLHDVMMRVYSDVSKSFEDMTDKDIEAIMKHGGMLTPSPKGKTADMSEQASLALMKMLSRLTRKLGVSDHVYIVGGAVRNFVIDQPIKDIDVVIDSLALGKDSEWLANQVARQIPATTDVVTDQYGVSKVFVLSSWMLAGHEMMDPKQAAVEIANARKESYGGATGKGYKPDQVDPATIEEDVLRREFTFNTLMWRLTDVAQGPDKAEIIDLTGCGLRDLKDRSMKCPSDPDTTFSDDPSRMLRAVKFIMKYDMVLTPDTEAAIRRNLSKLRNAPYEAVAGILEDTLLKDKATARKALPVMKRLGLLDEVADWIRDYKPFRSRMEGWVNTKPMLYLFDLMEVGLPLDANVRFLDRNQQTRLRQIALGMEDGEVRHLLAVLRQIGKAMDTGAISREFGLVKGAIGDMQRNVARPLVLADPSLANDSRKLTDAVRQELRKRKTAGSPLVQLNINLGEGEAVQKIIPSGSVPYLLDNVKVEQVQKVARDYVHRKLKQGSKNSPTKTRLAKAQDRFQNPRHVEMLAHVWNWGSPLVSRPAYGQFYSEEEQSVLASRGGTIELARIGGLSSVVQKGNKTAPEKKGIYAFLWPNIELYLASNFTGSGARAENTPSRMEQYQQGIKKLRRFKYDGDLWMTTAYAPLLGGKIKRYSKDGNWVLVDSYDARKASQRMHKKLVADWNTHQYTYPKAMGYHGFDMEWAQVFVPAHKGKIKGKKPNAQRVAARSQTRYDAKPRFRRGQVFRTEAGSEIALERIHTHPTDADYVDSVEFKVKSIAPIDISGPRAFFYERPKVGDKIKVYNQDLGAIGWPRVRYEPTFHAASRVSRTAFVKRLSDALSKAFPTYADDFYSTFDKLAEEIISGVADILEAAVDNLVQRVEQTKKDRRFEMGRQVETVISHPVQRGYGYEPCYAYEEIVHPDSVTWTVHGRVNVAKAVQDTLKDTARHEQIDLRKLIGVWKTVSGYYERAIWENTVGSIEPVEDSRWNPSNSGDMYESVWKAWEGNIHMSFSTSDEDPSCADIGDLSLPDEREERWRFWRGKAKATDVGKFDLPYKAEVEIVGSGNSHATRVAAKYKNKKQVDKADGSGKTTVYEYSKGQVDYRNREKAKKVEKLRNQLGELQSQVKADLKSSDDKIRMTALAVGLINDTYERVGNPSSAKAGHFGVTGWQAEHVSFSKGKAHFTYVGKSGVEQKKTTSDAELVKALKSAVEGKSGKDSIFENVGSREVNVYLKSFGITAKDIRGLHANRVMQTHLKEARAKGGTLPKDEKERNKKLKAEFKAALDATAEDVGHKASTLRSQYLVPGLEVNFLKDGSVVKNLAKQATKSQAEKDDEQAERMSRPAPSNKPPRKDLRRNRVDVDDKDVENQGADNDRDLSLNYKRVARLVHSEAIRQVLDRQLRSLVAGKIPKDAPEKKPGDYWESNSGWRAIAPDAKDGKSSPAKDEEAAKAIATGQSKPEKTPDEQKAEAEEEAKAKEKAKAQAKAEAKNRAKNFDKQFRSMLADMPADLAKVVQDGLPVSGSKEYQELADAYAESVEYFIESEDPRKMEGLVAKAFESLELFSESNSDSSKTSPLQDDRQNPLKDMTPERMGEFIAAAHYATEVVANPTVIGGRKLNGAKEPAALIERGTEAAREFAETSPEIRKVAAIKAAQVLKQMPKDDPNRLEMEVIADGLVIAAAANGEDLPVQLNRPHLSKGNKILCKHLVENGTEDMLLGSFDDYYGPSGRAAVGEALANMDDEELGEVGVEAGWGPLADKLKDKNVPESQKEWIRSWLREQGVEDMTTTQEVLETAAKQTSTSPAEIERQFAEAMKDSPDNQKWVERLLDPPKDSKAFEELSSEYAIWRSKFYLDWLKAQKVDLPVTHPVIARHQHVVETGDVSIRDEKLFTPEKKSIAQKKQDYLQNAQNLSSEERQRVLSMSSQEFEAMMAAISEDEEEGGETLKQAKFRRSWVKLQKFARTHG